MNDYIKLGKLMNALTHAQGKFNFNVGVPKDLTVKELLDILNGDTDNPLEVI